MPITPCFDPTTGASGGPSGGGGGSAYDVSPPAATTEATASGVALSAKTFGSFTGADAGSIDGYTARTVNAVGSTSWSGTGLGAYTPSGGADGDAGVLALDATIGGVVVATALHDYSRAAAGAASWATIHAIDFTSDITDLTLTKGAGSTTLYEADGTTVKATVGYADRTPTTVSTAVITAAAGKFLLTSDSGSATTESAYVYTELTESGTGVDWSDRSKTYAVDIVASSLGWGSNGDVVFVGIGTSAGGINSGSWFGVRLDRDGGTDFKDAGRRYLGSGENGANQNASASAITSRAIRIIVSAGVITDVYWQDGTTPLEGFPTPSASVFQSFEGGRAISMEASPETTLGATFYVIAEALSTSASDVVVGIEQIRIQEFG